MVFYHNKPKSTPITFCLLLGRQLDPCIEHRRWPARVETWSRVPDEQQWWEKHHVRPFIFESNALRRKELAFLSSGTCSEKFIAHPSSEFQEPVTRSMLERSGRNILKEKAHGQPLMKPCFLKQNRRTETKKATQLVRESKDRPGRLHSLAASSSED